MTAVFFWTTIAPHADTFRPVVRGKRGAVAAGHPLSAEAGMRLLGQGGNAVDAGCAAILAASVIEFSHFSFGGEVPIIIKTASGAPTVINGQGIAPRLATRERGQKASLTEFKAARDPARFRRQAFFRRRCLVCSTQW